jgi:hypothetical protein
MIQDKFYFLPVDIYNIYLDYTHSNIKELQDFLFVSELDLDRAWALDRVRALALDLDLDLALALARALALDLARARALALDLDLALDLARALALEKQIIRLQRLLNNNAQSQPKLQQLGVLTLSILLYIVWYRLYYKKQSTMRTSITKDELKTLISWLSNPKALATEPSPVVKPLLYHPEAWRHQDEETLQWYEREYPEAMNHPLAPLSIAKRLLKLMDDKGVDKIDISPEGFAKRLDEAMDEIGGGGE